MKIQPQILRVLTEDDRIVGTITVDLTADAKPDDTGTTTWAGRTYIGRATPNLAAMLKRYLLTREHTLSTAHMDPPRRVLEQVGYVAGELDELIVEVRALATAIRALDVNPDDFVAQARHANVLLACRNEIADVAISLTALAGMMPDPEWVETSIARKTEQDRGRG